MKRAVNTFVRFGYRRPPPWRTPMSKHAFQDGDSSNATGLKRDELPRSEKTEDMSPSSTKPSSTKPSSTKPSSPVHKINHRLPQFSEEDMKHWKRIKTEPLDLEAVYNGQQGKIPSLAHGIDVVLKGDGLYPMEAPWLLSHGMQQSHRRRFLFSNGLRRITHPDDIAWHQIPPYIPASRDSSLHELASSMQGVSFCSSTSSVVPTLSLLYHVISNYRNTFLQGGLSSHLQDLPSNFSKMHRRPVAVTVNRASTRKSDRVQEPRNNAFDNDKPVYVVNAHSGFDQGPSILRDLGHSMERMLTNSPAEFTERYVLQQKHESHANDFDLKRQLANSQSASSSPYSAYFQAAHANNHQAFNEVNVFSDANGIEIPDDVRSEEDQCYHYSRASRMLLRAQIDCIDNATGEVFDVKTRAVAPIRYDLPNYGAFTSHRLRFLQGRIDSYEREFYDMVRSVFLKYSLQLRIGRMSGALVAYHNTTELLGVEFIRLKEMESYIFGSSYWADVAFATSVRLFEEILSSVTRRTINTEDKADDKVKIIFSTEWANSRLFIFAQRLRSGEEDLFGPESFENFHNKSDSEKIVVDDEEQDLNIEAQNNQEVSNNPDTFNIDDLKNSTEPFLQHPLWQYDSFLHKDTSGGTKGVAIVGSHSSVEEFGGKLISGPQFSSSASSPRNSSSTSAAYSSWLAGLQKDDSSSRELLKSLLTNDAFQVWEVNIATIINGEQCRSGVDLDESDDFELRYDMREIERIEHEHLTKFLFALGSVYLR